MKAGSLHHGKQSQEVDSIKKMYSNFTFESSLRVLTPLCEMPVSIIYSTLSIETPETSSMHVWWV